MKEIFLTQKQLDEMKGIRGWLLFLALRVLLGIFISFLNAFLVYSYISWGFAYHAVYPLLFLMLGFLFCMDALLLFYQKRAFLWMYPVSSVFFIAVHAALGGWEVLLYGGLEALLLLCLSRSRRIAVTFGTKRIRLAGPVPGSFFKDPP